MKKCALIFLCLVFALVSLPVLAGAQRDGAAPQRIIAAPAAPNCYIADDPYGASIVTVIASSNGSEHMYWGTWEIGTDPITYNVKFVFKLPSTCANWKQVYKYYYPGSVGGTVVPFGVINSSITDCQGTAFMKVKTENSGCTYPFLVSY